MDPWRVVIDRGTATAPDILAVLEQLARDGADVTPAKPAVTLRGVDPAVVVAVIGAVSANLTVIIGGLLQLSSSRKGQRITVELASGSKVEFPAEMPAAERESLIRSLGEPPRRIILP